MTRRKRVLRKGSSPGTIHTRSSHGTVIGLLYWKKKERERTSACEFTGLLRVRLREEQLILGIVILDIECAQSGVPSIHGPVWVTCDAFESTR